MSRRDFRSLFDESDVSCARRALGSSEKHSSARSLGLVHSADHIQSTEKRVNRQSMDNERVELSDGSRLGSEKLRSVDRTGGVSSSHGMEPACVGYRNHWTANKSDQRSSVESHVRRRALRAVCVWVGGWLFLGDEREILDWSMILSVWKNFVAPIKSVLVSTFLNGTHQDMFMAVC